ncbi:MULTISPECIES: tRNA dihydrouridine(20/20a) synthase DusA [Candidatus Ichthyocystis]|uniref:tRNA dihydrouridine(20/20a) synthase DusA n=1 Tax=Candidatus Ichthyocystis TaxID=2929841 RepID=UPI000ADA62F4|nr:MULTISPECIES: tRNA dihydrouridine(20/20a) synthase DusA [Ichthyocystis]
MRTSRHIFSVAPMVDYTDRHARFLYRIMSRHACLYTEMLTANSVLHSVKDLLYHNDDVGPVVLQLGGNIPKDLFLCAKRGESAGYYAINLNCGCPSSRVVGGGFGVEMMRNPTHLISCLKAMQDAVSIEVTLKHRIGIDYTYCYSMFRDFVGTVADCGVGTFIIHARNAILERKISPKMNLSALKLRYDFVYRIKEDFPGLFIIINGHIVDFEDIGFHLDKVDGVMLGRKVLKDPWLLHKVDVLYDAKLENTSMSRIHVIHKFIEYAINQENKGEVVSAKSLLRYILNIMNGTRVSRLWKQLISGPDSSIPSVIDFLERHTLY